MNLDFIKKTILQPSVSLVGYGSYNRQAKNVAMFYYDCRDCDCICYECNDGDDDACNCERFYDCDYNCDCADDCADDYNYDCDCVDDCDCASTNTYHNDTTSNVTHIVGVRYVTQTSGCYYYLGDNYTYNIGDKVVVETSDGAEQMATVVFKRIYKAGETLPYNKNLLKTVIRKI